MRKSFLQRSRAKKAKERFPQRDSSENKSHVQDSGERRRSTYFVLAFLYLPGPTHSVLRTYTVVCVLYAIYRGPRSSKAKRSISHGRVTKGDNKVSSRPHGRRYLFNPVSFCRPFCSSKRNICTVMSPRPITHYPVLCEPQGITLVPGSTGPAPAWPPWRPCRWPPAGAAGTRAAGPGKAGSGSGAGT